MTDRSEVWISQINGCVDHYSGMLSDFPPSHKINGIDPAVITKHVIRRAAEMHIDADIRGEGRDYEGPEALISSLKFWNQGLCHWVPREFIEDCDAIMKEATADYEKYLELKERFEE